MGELLSWVLSFKMGTILEMAKRKIDCGKANLIVEYLHKRKCDWTLKWFETKKKAKVQIWKM